MDICVLCNREVDEETSAVLEMGAYGNPKYLCSECSSDLDTATLGTEVDEIASAMDRLGKKMAQTDPSSRTFETVSSILERAAERAKKIKDGSYDFALDEAPSEEEELEEIPEELRETEEDRELDRQDEVKEEKFNRFFDYVTFGVFVAVILFVGWKLIDTFILK
jgi:hypothetical protein